MAGAAAASVAAGCLKPLVDHLCGYVISYDSHIRKLKAKVAELDNARLNVEDSIKDAQNNMKPIKARVNKWMEDVEEETKEAHHVLKDNERAKKICFCRWLPHVRYCLGKQARRKAEDIQGLIDRKPSGEVYNDPPPACVDGASDMISSAGDRGDTIFDSQASILEEDTKEAHRVLEDDERAKKTCFCRWLPHVPYCLGRQARRKAEDIQGLIDWKPSGEVYNNHPLGCVDGASDMISSAGDRGDTIFNSQASILEDVTNALDDKKNKVVGVYGPGGVGKTTLLKEVEKKLREEKGPFLMIVKVRVSQILDLNNIIDQIADALGLKLKDKLSPQGKADVISKRLKSNPDEKVLIIFDNLWKKLDLDEVGIPWGDVSSKCKLLLTSRFEDVEKEMGADQTFLLQGLTDGEAFKLFENKVGDKLKDNKKLKSIAHQVVKKLAGLPLLINSVANTLKSSDESAWGNAQIDLDDPNKEIIETIVRLSYDHLKSKDAKYLFLLCGLIGGTIRVDFLFVLAMGLGLFERFNKTIQASRDRLNNMLNELRSACLLLDGGNDKDNVTIHDLYSGVVISTPFRDQNSLMMNSNYGSLSEEKLEKYWAICLDDVGRDRLAELMSWQFPSLKILMLSTPEGRGWMQKHRHDVGDCSRLLDFTSMKELQVLYLGSMYITNLPPSIKILGNLRTLFLDDCNVGDVAIIGKLKALQILSFARSTISRLPKEMGELTNLRLLNLSGCNELQRIEPGVLECLNKLEELYMKGSFDQWMGKNEKPSELCNARLAELRSMTKLNSLEISIRDPIILLEVDDLPFENLTRFWINIGNVNGREFKGLKTVKIKLKGHDSILSKTWIQKTLQKAQYLCLDGLGEFENTHESCIHGFPQLKHLDIQNSPSIKYITVDNWSDLLNIFPSRIIGRLHNLQSVKIKNCPSLKSLFDFGSLDSNTEQNMALLPELVSTNVKSCPSLESLFNYGSLDSSAEHKIISLPKLEKMKVSRAKKLRHVVMSHSQIVLGFPSLETVNVENCSDLGYLFPKYTATTLMKLERLKISKCEQMKEVILKEEVGRSEAEVMSFPCLSELILEELDNLISFGLGSVNRQLGKTAEENDESPQQLFNEMVTFPNIRNLKIEGIPCKELWNNHAPADSIVYSRQFLLENVQVKNCPSLKSLFNFGSLDLNTEQNEVLLPELVSINIENCPLLESLFNWRSFNSNVEHKIISFPKLESLCVSGAKKLRHVVMRHSQIVLRFPNLETVSVKNCSDLGYLFPKYTATTLMKLEWLEISKCKQMKEVILDKEVGRSEAEVMSFPCLSELILEELDNLISFGLGSVNMQLGKTAEENDESPQQLFNEMVTFPNIRNLKIEGIPCKELWNNHALADSIVYSRQFLLENVQVKNCPSLKSLFNFGSLDLNTEQNEVLLPELVSINIENCPSLESLFNWRSFNSNVEHKIISFPKLESLHVSGAKKLRHVVMRHSQIVLRFPNLETVSVKNCSDLGYLFPKYTATTLMKLEWLEISKCKQMKEVILDKEVGRSKAEVMSFPCLSELILEELDNLISFGLGSVNRQLGKTAEENDESPQQLFNEMVTFPNIRNLKIEGIPCKELWNNHAPADSIVCSSQFLLENVEVKNCPSLKLLFDFGSLDSNTEKNTVLLPELVSIDIENCPSLELLFNWRSFDSNVEQKIILFPKLESLRVSEAEKLRHVVMCHSQIVFGFPSLETVSVENCSDLGYLFPNYTATTLEKLKWLGITNCKQMKEVILEKEVGRSEAEVMSFPILSGLILEELDNLISFSSGSVKRQLGKTAEENDESPQPLFNEMVTFPNMEYLKIEGVPCKELWNNHVPADSIVCSRRFLSKNVQVKNCPSLKWLFDFESLDSNTEQNALLLPELVSIDVESCPSLESLFNCGSLDSNMEQNAVLLPELVSIDVESCPSLESLFNCGSLDSNAEHKIILLPKLKKVRVSRAKKLRHVVMSHSQIVFGFPSLETVSVENCSDLGYLFPNYTATTLEKLKLLEITKCKQMKEVILEKEIGRSEAEMMSFPCLSGLTLKELDNLISFGSRSVKRQLGETAKENDESPQPLFNEMVTFPNMEYLKIEGVPCKELWNNHVPADSIVCSRRFLSKNVQVKNCPSLKSLFDFRSLDSNMEQNVVLLPELVTIDIESCPSLESLFNCGSLDSNAEHKIILLPELKKVRVSRAKKLRHVVMSHSQIVFGFPSLEIVSVENCSDLGYLFPNYTATTLEKLKWLGITECKQMKEVILKKEVGRLEAKVMSFPCLSVLTLKELNNLISFGLGSVKRQLGETAEENDESPQPLFNEMVTFPNMEYLKIEGVPCKELWNNHVPADSIVCSHRFLSKNVQVKNCPSLKSLFKFRSLDSNTEQNAVMLPELVSIDIESCPSLESLFNCGSLDSNVEHKIILLPNLKKVRVSRAKKLRHVVMSHSQIVLGFPSLETISVENCSDLGYLFPNYTATTLEKLKWIEITKCKQMKEVILEKEVGRSEAEVMSFPCLSGLTLKELDNLISFDSRSVKRQLGETAEENDESPQPLFNEMVTFPNIRNLKIEGIPCKELWNNHALADSIICSRRFLLENVEVKNCSSLKLLFDFGSLDSNMEKNAVLLPELVSIDVKSCPSLESLFNYGSLDSIGEHKIIPLPKLEKVRVSRAEKLRHVVMSHSQIVLGFPRLETVCVEICSDLGYLFPKYTATTLMKLEWLEITKCKQMKEVILDKEVGQSEAEVMSFPCLSELTLKELDSLISFNSGSVQRQLGETAKENDKSAQQLFNEMVTFPYMRTLKIEGIPCKELWNNQIPIESFQTLEYLELKNCDNFQHIATSYMWKKLQRCLVELQVISCHSVEIIYEGDGTDIESGKLRRLELHDLKNLRCIWQSDSLPNIPFQNLRKVTAVRCPHLKMLFPTFTAKFLEQIKILVVKSCEDMELIAGHEKWDEGTYTIITFSELTILGLSELPKFKSLLPKKYSCSEDFPSLKFLSMKSCGAEPDQVLGDSEYYEID